MSLIERDLERDLENWKESNSPQTLCIFGPRRVGKSTLCRHWIKKSFKKIAHIDFEKESQLKHIFSQLNVDVILDKLEQCYSISRNDMNSLLFIDHINLFPRAIVGIHILKQTDLKCRIMITGNNPFFGFKKDYFNDCKMLYCGPVSFNEFLNYTHSIEDKPIINLTSFSIKTPPTPSEHVLLMDAFDNYLSLGGLPSVITNHCENSKFHRLIENNPGYKSFYFSKKSTAIPIQDQHKAYYSLYVTELKKNASSLTQYHNDRHVIDALPHFIGEKTTLKTLNSKKPHLVLNSLKNIESINFLTGINGLSKADNNETTSSYKRYYFPDLSLLHSVYSTKHISYNRLKPENNHYNILLRQFIYQELLHISNPLSTLNFWFRDKKSSQAYLPFLYKNNTSTIAIYAPKTIKSFYPSIRLFQKESPHNKAIIIAKSPLKKINQGTIIPPYLISSLKSL